MRNVFEHEGSAHFQLAPEHSDPDAVFFSAPSPSAEEDEHGTNSNGAVATNGAVCAEQGLQGSAHQSLQGEVPGSWHSSLEGTSSSDEEGESWLADEGGHEQQGGEGQTREQHGGPPLVRRRRGREEVDWERVESCWAAWGWLRHNPLGVPTEREHYCMQQQLPVYRVLLEKK